MEPISLIDLFKGDYSTEFSHFLFKMGIGDYKCPNNDHMTDFQTKIIKQYLEDLEEDGFGKISLTDDGKIVGYFFAITTDGVVLCSIDGSGCHRHKNGKIIFDVINVEQKYHLTTAEHKEEEVHTYKTKFIRKSETNYLLQFDDNRYWECERSITISNCGRTISCNYETKEDWTYEYYKLFPEEGYLLHGPTDEYLDKKGMYVRHTIYNRGKIVAVTVDETEYQTESLSQFKQWKL